MFGPEKVGDIAGKATGTRFKYYFLCRKFWSSMETAKRDVNLITSGHKIIRIVRAISLVNSCV